MSSTLLYLTAYFTNTANLHLITKKNKLLRQFNNIKRKSLYTNYYIKLRQPERRNDIMLANVLVYLGAFQIRWLSDVALSLRIQELGNRRLGFKAFCYYMKKTSERLNGKIGYPVDAATIKYIHHCKLDR